MTGSEAAAIVAVEILVEPIVIPPILVLIEEGVVVVHSALAVVVAGIQVLKAMLDLLGDMA